MRLIAENLTVTVVLIAQQPDAIKASETNVEVKNYLFSRYKRFVLFVLGVDIQFRWHP